MLWVQKSCLGSSNSFNSFNQYPTSALFVFFHLKDQRRLWQIFISAVDTLSVFSVCFLFCTINNKQLWGKRRNMEWLDEAFHWFCDRSWHQWIGWPAWVWPCGWARAPPPRPSPYSPRPSCWRCWSPTAVTWDTASMPCSSGRFVTNIVCLVHLSNVHVNCQYMSCERTVQYICPLWWFRLPQAILLGTNMTLPHLEFQNMRIHLNYRKDFKQNEARIAYDDGCTYFLDTMI